jgi:hypothetical protein
MPRVAREIGEYRRGTGHSVKPSNRAATVSERSGLPMLPAGQLVRETVQLTPGR